MSDRKFGHTIEPASGPRVHAFVHIPSGEGWQVEIAEYDGTHTLDEARQLRDFLDQGIRFAETWREPKPKTPSMSREDAAKLLGETCAKVSAEAIERTRNWLNRGDSRSRRLSFTELQEKGGPPAVLAGHVMRRHPDIVQQAAGKTVRVYLVSGQVQIDPVVT